MFVRHNSRNYIVFCGEWTWLTIKHEFTRADIFEYLMTLLCAQIQFTKLSQNVRNSGINMPVFLSKMVLLSGP